MMKCFLTQDKSKHTCFIFPLNTAERKNNRDRKHNDWEGRSKHSFIHRKKFFTENLMESTKRLLELNPFLAKS